MHGELLILFVILLLGLVLCSFLGGNSCVEGMKNMSFTDPNGATAYIKIDSEGKTIRIEIGCAKPCIFTTESLGTEFVFTNSLPNSKVAVNGLEFLPMRLTRPSIR